MPQLYECIDALSKEINYYPLSLRTGVRTVSVAANSPFRISCFKNETKIDGKYDTYNDFMYILKLKAFES